MQRHLAAFKTLDANARARRLTLAATARLLACLPLPEPMPRPTRVRGFDDPGLSLTSLSFMAASLLAVDDAHEMRDLGDHSAIGRSVRDA